VSSPLPSIFLYILYHFSHTKLLLNCVTARVSSCILWQLTRESLHDLLPISYFPYFSESIFTIQTAVELLWPFSTLNCAPSGAFLQKVLPLLPFIFKII
jgi:hypothetical protein